MTTNTTCSLLSFKYLVQNVKVFWDRYLAVKRYLNNTILNFVSTIESVKKSKVGWLLWILLPNFLMSIQLNIHKTFKKEKGRR